MSTLPAPPPADLDIVRDSYDRVADNYVEMVTITGIGDIRTHPWLNAAMDAFASTVAPIGPVALVVNPDADCSRILASLWWSAESVCS